MRVHTVYYNTTGAFDGVAFKFCLKYQRRTEFRKLCEIVSRNSITVPVVMSLLPSAVQLKNHLTQAQKYQSQSHSLRFENPETIQYLVDVRFEQLECSISIDLWQVNRLKPLTQMELQLAELCTP